MVQNIIRASLPSEMRIVEGLIDFTFSYKLVSNLLFVILICQDLIRANTLITRNTIIYVVKGGAKSVRRTAVLVYNNRSYRYEKHDLRVKF